MEYLHVLLMAPDTLFPLQRWAQLFPSSFQLTIPQPWKKEAKQVWSHSCGYFYDILS